MAKALSAGQGEEGMTELELPEKLKKLVVEFMDKEEMERDAFMDGMNVGYEPKPELMKEFHYPVENQKQIKVDIDGESLQEESSDSEGEKRAGSEDGESKGN